MRRILLWSAIALVLAWSATRADFGGNLAALLPGGDDPFGREVAFFEDQRATQVLALEAWPERDGLGQADAVRALQTVAERLRAHGAEPVSAGGGEALAKLEAALYDHLPVLLPEGTLDQLRPRLAGDGLKQWLAQVRERAARPDDLATAAAARHDLLAVGGLALAPLRRHLPGGASGGAILHRDGVHAMLLMEVAFPPDDAARTSALMDAADAAVADAATAGVRVETIGSYRHFRDNLEGLLRDLLSAGPVSVLLIAVVLWSLVRDGRTLLWIHLPAALAMLAAVAVLGLRGQPAPLMLLGFASPFLGIAVENAIHMATALQGGHQRIAMRPMVVSYLTTAVAFACLMLSAVPALRMLGLLVLVGLLVAMAASLTLLPALVRARRAPAPWRRITTGLIGIAGWSTRRRLVITGLISIALIPGLWRLESLADLKRMDGSRAETWQALDTFLGRWGSLDSSSFLVAEHADLDRALERLERAHAVTGLPQTALGLLVPSAAEQRRRLAAWNAFWREHAASFAAELRAVGGERLAAACAPSLERYRPRETVAPVSPATWDGTPFARLFAQFVQHGDGRWQVVAPLIGLTDPRTPDLRAAEAVEAKLAAAGIDDVWTASRGRLAHRLVEVVHRDLRGLGGWMAVAMVALVWLIERRLRHVLAIVLPPALALAWTFGLLGWCGVPLTLFSVIVGAFVAGIGLDNAVFLAQPAHRSHTLAPVLCCTVTALVGTASLITAGSPLLRNAGIALVAGLSACLVACLLLTPLLMGPEPAEATGKPPPRD